MDSLLVAILPDDEVTLEIHEAAGVTRGRK